MFIDGSVCISKSLRCNICSLSELEGKNVTKLFLKNISQNVSFIKTK